MPGIEHQWRSEVGVTADGTLVYAVGPGLDPLQLDINPSWPVFASYDLATRDGLAAPSNGSKLLASAKHGPWTFFEPWWARDFITMSARPPKASTG